MKLITLIAVAAIVLLIATGGMPDSSVGGPLTLAFAFLVAALAVGIHDARSNARGVLGWIVSIVVALIGGLAAAAAGGTLTETLITQFSLQGSLADSHRSLFYVTSVAIMLVTLFGAWIALWLVNRMR